MVSDKCEPVSVSPTQPHTSGSDKAAPLGESGGTGQLVGVAVLEVALRGKMVVDRGMDGGELLQRSHAPEPQHRPFASSERQVRVFGPIVEPAPHLTIVTAEPKSGSNVEFNSLSKIGVLRNACEATAKNVNSITH